MEEYKTDELSIHDAFQSGLDEPGEAGDGSSDEKGDPTPKGGESPEDKPDETPDETPEGGDDGKPKDGEPNSKPDEGKGGDGKDPTINPDEGKYEGEYTKERFDGLMSQWQKDRSDISELKTQVKELSTPKDTPKSNEPELPPELANADEDTRKGFDVFMKSVEDRISSRDKSLLDKVQEVLTAPARKEAETATKVQQEVELLSAELGPDFKDNAQDIVTYAGKNGHQLGSLRQAFTAYMQNKEIQTLKDKLGGGKKTAEELANDKKKDADIPSGDTNRANIVPKYDPSKDGEKSLSDLYSEALDEKS